MSRRHAPWAAGWSLPGEQTHARFVSVIRVSGWTDMDRGARALNVTLLTLLATALVSGVVAFGTGFPGPAAGVVAIHGASGLGLLLLAPAKICVARRGLRRPGRLRKAL